MPKTTLTSIRLNTKIKRETQILAEEMGMTLSMVLNIMLANFVRTRRLVADLNDTYLKPSKKTHLLKEISQK